MRIAMQLYSLRNYGDSKEQLKETLKNLRSSGYKHVETAGYFGLSVAEFAALLEESDLSAISTHTGIEAIAGNLSKVIEDHKLLGAKHCCIPGLPGSYYHRTVAGFTAAAEVMNLAAEKLAEHDISLSFHNHGHEFLPMGDSCGLDYILQNAPLVNMQLDVGHAYAAHVLPQEWLRRYGARIKTVHYKDVKFIDNVRRDYPIGEGDVNWSEVTAEIKDSTCEYIIVEHEEFIRDVWDVCKTSYDNIVTFLEG